MMMVECILFALLSAAATPAPRMTVDGDGNLRDPSGAAFLARGVNWGKRSMSKDGSTLYNESDPLLAKRLLPGVNHVRLVLDYLPHAGGYFLLLTVGCATPHGVGNTGLLSQARIFHGIQIGVQCRT